MTNNRITKGSIVYFEKQQYYVVSLEKNGNALCTNSLTKEIKLLPVEELSLFAEKAEFYPDLNEIDPIVWEKANKRFEAIKPLLDIGRSRVRIDVDKQAQVVGVSAATLYQWIKLFESTGTIHSLIPKQRADKNKQKLDEKIRQIIDEIINKYYLTSQKSTVANIIVKVNQECLKHGLPLPHGNTIRGIVNKLPDEIRAIKWLGKNKALKFQPVEGHFPGADYPLSLIQIDHTKLDIILVDDLYRQPIARPNLTLALDVYSRMVAGYYLSFDPPGFLSVGMCITNAILPKESELIKRDINAQWPIYGMMDIIHADNGKDFRSEYLKRSCGQYRVDLQWRPVRTPKYGGHVERFFGTLNAEVHNLPGTTFSDPKKRENYDSDAKSSMTISEFEKWLLIYITEIYHQRLHSEINDTPVNRFIEGIYGTKDMPGHGIPSKTYDESRLKLDFMPFIERTIQVYGVQTHGITYYHDSLRRWINATDPTNRKLKRQFLFRFDPRDISAIYFYDPELCSYFRIPYRDTSHPPISVWELRNIQKDLKSKRVKPDERAIFEAYNKLDQIKDNAQKASRSARLQSQRKRENAKIPPPIVNEVEVTNVEKLGDIPVTTIDSMKIKPFDDITE